MTETPTPPPPAEKPSRWWFVHGSIVLAFVLFFAFVAVLYWYWLRTPEPTAIISVPGGEPALNGAMIHIEGERLAKPLEVSLSEANNYGARIYLVPGEYQVEVKDRGGTPVLAHRVTVEGWHELTLRIPVELLSRPSQ